jgi:uncharacterized protein (DUF1684 family)
MRTILFVSTFLLCSTYSAAQSNWAHKMLWSNYEYRLEQNKEFADSAQSPLTAEDRLQFQTLNWFPIDTNYMIRARLERTDSAVPFELATTTARKAKYRQFGILHFQLGVDTFHLPVYQNLRVIHLPQYKNQLFFPFTDDSNGFSTYGGGRYLDIKIPAEDSLIIDFNRAYNPYCAYNDRYSCPIPPKENNIPAPILAGVIYHSEH